MFFRHSEVIAAGDLFSTISYPLIDTDKGGTIQGVIDGLNHILDLSVAEYRSQGHVDRPRPRTAVGHRRRRVLRNMLVMIRDRIRDLKKQGRTLDQVKAARPTGLRRALAPQPGPGRRACSSRPVYKTIWTRRKRCASCS